MIWVKALYDALEKFEPLRDHFDYLEKLLAAALWPTNVFVREAIVGAWECDFKQFGEKTTHDLENAARGFTVNPLKTCTEIVTSHPARISMAISHGRRGGT
jgi:hypothetical protein